MPARRPSHAFTCRPTWRTSTCPAAITPPPPARLAEEALAGAEETGNRDQYLEGHINLGVCALARSDLAGAFSSLRRATALARCTGDTGRQAVAMACLSRTLTALGQLDRAREVGKDAARDALRVGSRRAELLAEQALGEAHRAAGLARDALYHFGRSLEVARGMRVRREEAELLVGRGHCYRLLDDAAAAHADCRAALDVARALGAHPVEAGALLLAGRLALDAGDAPAAVDRAQEVESLAATMGAAEVAREGFALHGAAHLALGQRGEAADALGLAVREIERMRGSIRAAGLEDSLLEDAGRCEAYVNLARALGSQGELERLVESVEWPPLIQAMRAAAGKSEG